MQWALPLGYLASSFGLPCLDVLDSFCVGRLNTWRPSKLLSSYRAAPAACSMPALYLYCLKLRFDFNSVKACLVAFLAVRPCCPTIADARGLHQLCLMAPVQGAGGGVICMDTTSRSDQQHLKQQAARWQSPQQYPECLAYLREKRPAP